MRTFAAALLLGLTFAACDTSEPASNPVEALGGLQPRILEAAIDTVHVDLAPAFRSTDALTYSAAVQPEGAAEATVSGSRLTLVGRQTGTAQVVVTARAPGGSATASFPVTITPQGLVQYDALPAPPAEMRVTRDSFEVRLSNYYRHTNGQALSYTLVGTSGPVQATLVGSDLLRLKPTGEGPIRVTARVSAGGKSLTTTFSTAGTTHWCWEFSGQRRFGVPRSGDVWRFDYLQVDPTPSATDTLHTANTWTITGPATCTMGVQTFDVTETRTGTLSRTTSAGVRTVTPMQETRSFQMVLDEVMALGPYTVGMLPFPYISPMSGDLLTTERIWQTDPARPTLLHRFLLTLSFSGGIEALTKQPLSPGATGTFALTRVR